MNIDPTFTSVGNLFKQEAVYYVPKYQRSYAWDEESVKDYIKDIKERFSDRKAGSSNDHFFGGILCVKHTVSGTLNQHEFEIIDGQQRLTTYTLTVLSLIKIYNELVAIAIDNSDLDNQKIVEKRIEKLKERFVQFSREVHRTYSDVDVLKLSKADGDFYKQLMQNLNPVPSRNSHYKLQYAYKEIFKSLKEIINPTGTLEDQIDNAQIIEHVIDNDFTILRMVTENKKDAYRLFQVINDRGLSLTEGDLLRAKTLENLEGSPAEQNAVELIWDEILADHPSTTANYLNWIFESYHGFRPKQNELYDQFLEKFFPSALNAAGTLARMQEIKNDIDNCRKLVKGQWLYSIVPPTTGWDASRLEILINALGHTLSIPLLLAANKLDQKAFSEIVHLIERTFFRYKLICNQHVGPLKKIYYDEALLIRQNLAAYNVNTLKTKLSTLVSTKANNVLFSTQLQGLSYKDGGGGNQILKYFLLTTEDYYECYKRGAPVPPRRACVDKSRLYSFSGLSIEHIYPRNAQGADINPIIEDFKNSIGNMTIMDPAQNSFAGNEPFTTKAPIYRTSSVKMLQEIGNKPIWQKADIDDHKDHLIEIALKVFS